MPYLGPCLQEPPGVIMVKPDDCQWQPICTQSSDPFYYACKTLCRSSAIPAVVTV